jgi:DNA-binding transcriptional regulator YiaG
MPNIASVLKSEIARVARKEVRGETLGLKKAASTHRSDIAALKRRIQLLERQLRQFARTAGSKEPPSTSAEGPQVARRFSPKGFASQRRRLGLSAADCGLLIGASSQTVYNWEQGKARPRAAHFPAIDAMKTVGKKVVAARLAQLKTAA